MWRILHSIRGGRSILAVEPSAMVTTSGGAVTAATADPPEIPDPLAAPHRSVPVDGTERTDPDAIGVPDLAGLTTQDARRVTRLAGLHIVVDARSSPAGPWGRVLSQEPEPGAFLAPGDIVGVVVGSRPLVVVPDVHGRDEAEVLADLQALGLVPGRRAVRKSDGVPAGHVVRARPRPGSEVPAGTHVSYVVAAYPRPHGKRVHEAPRRVRVRRLPDGRFSSYD